MLTPPTHLLKSHDGNSTSPTGTLEAHLQAEGVEDTHRTPRDHPQVVGVVEVAVGVVEVAEGAVEVVVGAEERSHYPDTRRPNLLKNS